MSKWKIALLGSIIINLLLFATQSEIMKFGVPGGTGKDESVEVTLVQDEQSEALPPIEKPKPQPVETPPEEKDTTDASAMAVTDGIPVSDDTTVDKKQDAESKQQNDANKQSQAAVPKGNPLEGDPRGKKSDTPENTAPKRPEAVELAGNQHQLSISVASGTELPSVVSASYVVSVDGTPEHIQIQSTGDSDVDDQIYALVASWRFAPALNADGEPMVDSNGVGNVYL